MYDKGCHTLAAGCEGLGGRHEGYKPEGHQALGDQRLTAAVGNSPEVRTIAVRARVTGTDSPQQQTRL